MAKAAGLKPESQTSSRSDLPTVAVGRLDPLLDVECDFCDQPAIWNMIRERSAQGMARTCMACALRGFVQLLPEVSFEDDEQ